MKQILVSGVMLMASFAFMKDAYCETWQVAIAVSPNLRYATPGFYKGDDESARDMALRQCKALSLTDCTIAVEASGPGQCLSVASDISGPWIGKSVWSMENKFAARNVAIGLGVEFCAQSNGNHPENCRSRATICNY